MSYRIHFVYATKTDVDVHELEDVLCLEMCPAITSVWDKCKPLYSKDSKKYTEYEEYHPCIVTKKRLRQIIENFLETYRQYLVEELIVKKNPYDDVTIDDNIWNRCLHLPYDHGKVNNDDVKHAENNGCYSLHAEFIKVYNKEHFLDLLDNKYKITYGNTMYDILIQLIYMYKTFSNSKKLIILGW